MFLHTFFLIKTVYTFFPTGLSASVLYASLDGEPMSNSNSMPMELIKVFWSTKDDETGPYPLL